jgi:hypothetical protein
VRDLYLGDPHLNDAEKGGRHIWISSPKLQDLKNYHTKDILPSALAHLWQDNSAQLPDVEKTLYIATNEAWKEYEASYTPFPQPSRMSSPRNYPTCLRAAQRLQTPTTWPGRPTRTRLSAICSMLDRRPRRHSSCPPPSGKAPLRTTLPNYTPIVDRQFCKWGLDCRMVELSNFTN